MTRRRFGQLAGGLAIAAASLALPGGSAFAAPARATGTRAGATADPNAPLAALRGMWIASVTNIDWPSATGLSVAQQQDELTSWFDLARSLNLNAVMLQVRPSADAFWPSQYEPWSQYLTGTQGVDPGYDPLAFAVDEAHKRNLALHAWFNPYRVSLQSDPNQLVPTHPARVHPDWIFTYGGQLYYNPGIPDVREFVEDAILDALGHDVDGVHFDDYFYPYPVSGQTLPDQDTFAEYGGGFTDIGDWRRNNVDLLISEMYQRVHAAKPHAIFGVSPFGIWRNSSSDPAGSATSGTESYSANYADTRLWVEQRWLDYINPQVYWNIGFTAADYAVLVPWWSEQVDGTGVQLYIGEAAYKVGVSGQPAAWQDPAELSKHLTLDQQYPQVAGNVYFSATEVRDDPLGAITELATEHYAHPALTPPMPRLDPAVPRPPAVTSVRGNTIAWRATGGPAPTSYAVFRFDAKPVPTDFADATHLIATVHATGHQESYTDTTAQPGNRYWYAVMAVSRTSIRSTPSAAHPS